MNNDPFDPNGGGQRNYQNYQNGQTPDPNGNSYQQYPYGIPQNGFVPDAEAPMTVGQWIVTLLLTSLPCVGIIMLFVWAFGNEPGKKSRANFCKAMLIFMLVLVVLEIILIVIAAATGAVVGSSIFDSL